MVKVEVIILSYVKEELERICDQIGIEIPVAFTLFARKLVEAKALPFAVDGSKEEVFASDSIRNSQNRFRKLKLQFKLDYHTKYLFDSICEQIGIPSNTAFNMFAKKVIAERNLPFKLHNEITPNQVNAPFDVPKTDFNVNINGATIVPSGTPEQGLSQAKSEETNIDNTNDVIIENNPIVSPVSENTQTKDTNALANLNSKVANIFKKF